MKRPYDITIVEKYWIIQLSPLAPLAPLEGWRRKPSFSLGKN